MAASQPLAPLLGYVSFRPWLALYPCIWPNVRTHVTTLPLSEDSCNLPTHVNYIYCNISRLRFQRLHRGGVMWDWEADLNDSSCSMTASRISGAIRSGSPWSESASELYRPSDRCLPMKLVPTFADRGCSVISVTDPYSRILGILDRSRYFFCQVAPQMYSRGWVEPVPDPLHFGKCGSAKNRTRTSGSVAKNSDH
jgi:hypothetical protein